MAPHSPSVNPCRMALVATSTHEAPVFCAGCVFCCISRLYSTNAKLTDTVCHTQACSHHCLWRRALHPSHEEQHCPALLPLGHMLSHALALLVGGALLAPKYTSAAGGSFACCRLWLRSSSTCLGGAVAAYRYHDLGASSPARHMPMRCCSLATESRAAKPASAKQAAECQTLWTPQQAH